MIVEQIVCRGADQGAAESVVATAPAAARLELRVTVAGGVAMFSYSLDRQRFHDLGDRFEIKPGKWVGAKIGLVATRPGTTLGGRSRGRRLVPRAPHAPNHRRRPVRNGPRGATNESERAIHNRKVPVP